MNRPFSQSQCAVEPAETTSQTVRENQVQRNTPTALPSPPPPIDALDFAAGGATVHPLLPALVGGGGSTGASALGDGAEAGAATMAVAPVVDGGKVSDRLPTSCGAPGHFFGTLPARTGLVRTSMCSFGRNVSILP